MQEFGKHRSSCVWREGDKEKGLSRPGIGLGEGGEQNDIGIHPMAQTPNLSLWKLSQDLWEKGREEGLPYPESDPSLFVELPGHRPMAVAWLFCVFLTKQVTMQNQPGLLKSLHPYCASQHLDISKTQNGPNGIQTYLCSDTICNSHSILDIHLLQGRLSLLIRSAFQSFLPYLQVLESVEGWVLLITQSWGRGRKVVALLSVSHPLLHRS